MGHFGWKLSLVSFRRDQLSLVSEPIPASTASRHRKGKQTAERILDAAEELFAERGYAGTALRDVAAMVDLRTPSLYNHFPNKESAR